MNEELSLIYLRLCEAHIENNVGNRRSMGYRFDFTVPWPKPRFGPIICAKA